MSWLISALWIMEKAFYGLLYEQRASLWSVNPVLRSLSSVIILLTGDLYRKDRTCLCLIYTQAVFYIVFTDLMKKKHRLTNLRNLAKHEDYLSC